MYYIILGLTFIIVLLLSYVGVLFILTIISSIGNEICKSFGMKDSYLEMKVRDIFAFVITCLIIYGIIWIVGKIISLFL